jgi:hypothetical protein
MLFIKLRTIPIKVEAVSSIPTTKLSNTTDKLLKEMLNTLKLTQLFLSAIDILDRQLLYHVVIFYLDDTIASA